MPAFSASAPGKIILFGEHAVVYGRPALAVPVKQVAAKAVAAANPGSRTRIEAPAIGLDAALADLPADHPLALAVQGVQDALGLDHLPAFRLKITSTIPIAAGLGSGAAVTVAIARALSALVGKPLDDEQVSAVAFRVDQAYHGTPSGVDNTVIAYAQPVAFTRGQPFERLRVPVPFSIVIASTGIRAATSAAVGDVRQGWQENPSYYEPRFDRIGALAAQARQLIEEGKPAGMGPLMDENHQLLCEMGVSCDELDRLVAAARGAGALGAKLSGGGRGGNMIALAYPESSRAIEAALRGAGAVQTIITRVD